VGELTILVDTANHLAGQIESHSSLEHTMSLVDIQWRNFEPQVILLMPVSGSSGSTGSVLVFYGLIGSAKAICISRSASIYSNFVTVSAGTVLECGYFNKQ